jgi:spore maturation protein CgeB
MNIAFFVHSLVSDWNHGNAHFLRGICSELVGRGHRLKVYEPESAWSVQNLVETEGVGPLKSFRQAYPQLQSSRYQALNPNEALSSVDLAIVHEWNDRELIAALGACRKQRSNLVLLFHDTHHRAVSDPGFLPALDLSGYDGVLAYGESLAKVYRKYYQHVWVWHEAADIRVFRPLPFSRKKRDLVWIGNWGDDERTRELSEFLLVPANRLQLDATVFGVRYPETAKASLAESGIAYGGWIANYRVPIAFSQYRVTMHIPRRPYVTQLPGIPTIRPFEALACGIPLISSPWNDVEGLFRPNHDFLFANDGPEMVDRLHEILSSPKLARALIQRGLETIHARHTCAHRVDQLLRIVNNLVG